MRNGTRHLQESITFWKKQARRWERQDRREAAAEAQAMAAQLEKSLGMARWTQQALARR